jgi:hypothetical protein
MGKEVRGRESSKIYWVSKVGATSLAAELIYRQEFELSEQPPFLSCATTREVKQV